MADNLVKDVNKSSNHGRKETYFIVTLESSSELTDQSSQDQLSHLRQFRVDDSDEGSENRGKWQTGCLGLHDTASKQSTSTNEILRKQFRHNVLYVGHVDSIDNTGD